MPTFLTEYAKDDGRYEGPDIEADSWEDAQQQANALDVDVLGILMERHIFYDSA